MISKNSFKELNKIIDLGNADLHTKSGAVYYFLQQSTLETCQWYWKHIGRKRRASFFLLIIVFMLIIFATFTQFYWINIINNTPERRLLLSQLSIGLYMLAAILFSADKVFGWTSGWVRYVSTVMNIEACYHRFLLEWFSINIESNKTDKEQFSQRVVLAKSLIKQILEIKNQEMVEWATEFGDGVSQLRAISNERSKLDGVNKIKQPPA